MATHNESNIVRNYLETLDDGPEPSDHRRRPPGSERSLPHWSDHRMNYSVSDQLHDQVLELLDEYEASRPRQQFAAQVRDVRGSYEFYGSTVIASDVVLARWAEQGLASYKDADRWGHEELPEPPPNRRMAGLPRLPRLYAGIDLFLNPREPPSSSNPDRSRPLFQFMAQVEVESRSLLDQFRYDGLVRSYDNDDGGPNGKVARGSTVPVPLEIGIRDLGTLAYKRVQRKWINWRIWDKRWGSMPGYSWKHEQYLDDFMRESMGKERFALLPPNYLQGMGKLRAYNDGLGCPEAQNPAAPRRFSLPPVVLSGGAQKGHGAEPSTVAAPGPAAPAIPGVAIKAEDYQMPESEGGRSNIENEEPIVDNGEPTIKIEEPDEEMEMPVIKREEAVEYDAPAVGLDEPGGAGAGPAIKEEEADPEMEDVVVKKEEHDIKPTLLEFPLQTRGHTLVNPSSRPHVGPVQIHGDMHNSNCGAGGHPISRPKSNLTAILNNDSSDCPFTNPDYNPDSTRTNCPYTNSTRAVARGGLGPGPSRAPPALTIDERPSPRGLPPCRWGNPRKVLKPDSSSVRSITSAAAERAALLAVPRPHAATAAAAAASQAWLNQHKTYAQEGQAGGWMGPGQSTTTTQAWQSLPHAAVKQEKQSNDSAVPCPPAAQGDRQVSGSESRSARTGNPKKGKGKHSAE